MIKKLKWSAISVNIHTTFYILKWNAAQVRSQKHQRNDPNNLFYLMISCL